MTQVSVVGPGDGESIVLGPTRMRILEDGEPPSTGSGSPSPSRPAQPDRCSTATPSTTRASTCCPARCGSPSATTTYDASAGTLVMVPPGAPHTFANPGDDPSC